MYFTGLKKKPFYIVLILNILIQGFFYVVAALVIPAWSKNFRMKFAGKFSYSSEEILNTKIFNRTTFH